MGKIKSILVSILFVVSGSASARLISEDELPIFNKQIQQVEVSDNCTDIIISSNSSGYQRVSDSTNYLSQFTEVPRVTATKASQMNLTIERSFYVYSGVGTVMLTKSIITQLERDRPDYFSIVLYKGYSETAYVKESVAYVVEYSAAGL